MLRSGSHLAPTLICSSQAVAVRNFFNFKSNVI